MKKRMNIATTISTVNCPTSSPYANDEKLKNVRRTLPIFFEKKKRTYNPVDLYIITGSTIGVVGVDGDDDGRSSDIVVEWLLLLW